MGKIGRYRLRGEIGRGGMATVYRAHDPHSNRDVAIKVLPREMMHNPDFRKRFTKELSMICSLEHMSIVPVYDSGEEDGQPYFVMRYMTGGSLKEWLKRGPLSLQDTASIVERIALGLDYAHKRKIIHRDLKPDNILFDANDNPYISDFGVAKLFEVGASSTDSGIIGTPAYASPEQARGESNKLDARSDIYSLGVLTFQMLTGQQPYKADTPLGVLVKHIQDPLPNILDVNPNLPASVDTIIKTAMAKNREDRYTSVLEFARALSIAAFGEQRTMPAALALERRQAAASVRNRKNLIFAGGAALLVLVAGYFALPLLNSPPAVPIPTGTAVTTVTSSVTPSPVPPTASPTGTATAMVQIPVTAPTPLGGARAIALVSGNSIIQMNLDGSDPIALDSQNFDKSNLQWLSDGRLIYISPTRRCVYITDADDSETVCFQEHLTGFRVSPDGTRVAISVDNSLYIIPFKSPFRESSWKGTSITKDHLAALENACRYSSSIKDVRWSNDGGRVAALVIDPEQNNSEQIHVFSVTATGCSPRVSINPISIDEFPGHRFVFDSRKRYSIPSYDWDGDHRFLLNNYIRNDVFGHLYLYDSNTRKEKRLEPVGSCCYADARWSPDGNYVLFLYQNEIGSDIHLYYISTSDLVSTGEWEPALVPPNILPMRRHIYPVWKLVE